MRLIRVRLRNFRCYKDETTIDIGDITALIGKNDSGKSSVLDALNIFFEEGKIDQDDASKTGTPKDVCIICEFEDLPRFVVVDADYETTLEKEYLLNTEKRLEIHKVYDCSLKNPKISGTYIHAMHPCADKFDDLLTLKRNELKQRAQELGIDLSNVDERINALIRSAIWGDASDLQLGSKEIPIDDVGAKQIWEQLKKYLPVFALFKSDRSSTDQDDEAQDPMKAAIKEAIKAQEDKLNEIKQHVEKEVKAIAESTVEKIKEMDPNLASQMKPTFMGEPAWEKIFKFNLIGDDEIPINKRGSGVRRLVLLNFFRAKAEQKIKEKEATSVVYAVEEPETSQHPNSQRMLIEAFEELAEQQDCQVILTTHTPALCRLLPLSSLRYIAIEERTNRHILSGNEQTYSTVAKSLGVLADHDVKLFISVEGWNDINFFRIISKILHSADNTIPDLFDLEDKGQIVIFPMGGENLLLWSTRTKPFFNIPEFYIVDSNITAPGAISPNQAKVDEINRNPRCTAILTGKREMENYLHPTAIKAARASVEITFGDFDDVPKLAGDVLGQNTKTAKKWLNTKAASLMTSELLDERDPKGEIRGWLTQIQQLMSG